MADRTGGVHSANGANVVVGDDPSERTLPPHIASEPPVVMSIVVIQIKAAPV